MNPNIARPARISYEISKPVQVAQGGGKPSSTTVPVARATTARGAAEATSSRHARRCCALCRAWSN
eukprot:503843-Pyramimonas_sp.AAC.1